MKLARWALVCLVFFALPLLLLVYGVDRQQAIAEEEDRERSFEELEQALLPLCFHHRPERYVARIIQALSSRGMQAHDWQATLARGISRLKRRFPGAVEFYVTDGTGRRVAALTDGQPPEEVLGRLYAMFRQIGFLGTLQSRFVWKEADSLLRGWQRQFPRCGQVLRDLRAGLEWWEGRVSGKESIQETILAAWPVVGSFLGPQATPPELLKALHETAETSIRPRHAFFFAFVGPRFGLMGHLNRVPGWESLPARDLAALRRPRLRARGIRVGSLDAGSRGRPASDTALALALTRFQTSQSPRQEIGAERFVLIRLNSTTTLWAGQPRRTGGDGATRLAGVLAGLIFLPLAVLSYLVMVGGYRFALPIRWKLLLLFGFAGGLPLLIVGLAGREYLSLRYREGVGESLREMETLLRLLDSGYPKMIGSYQRRLARFLKDADYRSQEGRRKLHQRLQEFRAVSREGDLMIGDAKGRIVWTAKASDQADASRAARDTRKLLGTLISTYLGAWNEESGSFTSFLIVDLLESLTPGVDLFTEMSRNIGRIFEMGFDKKPIWAYFHPLTDPDGKATWMVFCRWYRPDLEKEFLDRQLLQFQRSYPGTQFLAVGEDFLDEGISPATGLERQASAFFQLVSRQAGTVMTRWRTGGSTWLIAGLRPKEMRTRLLMALRPDTTIREEVAHEARLLGGFAATCVGILVFLGLMLARRVLNPVRELGAAMAAIKERRFRHRVPTTDGDELGDLGRTFNRALDSLSDLEVARIVQESLLPDEAVTRGDILIYGASRPAAQLGGDYFDLRARPDGGVLFLIGDVAGHGVQAAILMAMAKALVVARERGATQAGEPLSPGSVLDFIHETVFQGIRFKRMMTCLVGMVDPSGPVLHLANAGHNFPIRFSPGREPQMIEFPGSFPLGTRKKGGHATLEVALEPGETLLLYTDGFVEAKDREGRVLGYRNAFSALGSLMGRDPRTAFARILDWHSGVVTPGPQEDDITLLLVQRLAGEKAAPDAGGQT